MFSSEQYEAIGQLIPLINQHAGRFALLRSDWWENPQEKCQEYLTEHFATLPHVLGEALESARRLDVQAIFAGALDYLDQESGGEDSLASTYRVFRMLEVTSDLCLHHLGAPLVTSDLTLVCLILNTFCGDEAAQAMDERIEAAAQALFSGHQPSNTGFQSLLQRLGNSQNTPCAESAMAFSFN